MKTLYEKLGGEAAVDAAVDKFYEKVLQDERIKGFFHQVDMVQLRGHQKRFLTYALGGASSYSGKMIRVSHKDLVDKKGLSDLHFDAILENLSSTLKELSVPDTLISEVSMIVESTRKEILNR